MNTKVIRRKLIRKLLRRLKHPMPTGWNRGWNREGISDENRSDENQTLSMYIRQRGESSLLSALFILTVLVWMSAIPLLYFQRLMELGKSHGQVQLLTAVNEEIHRETIRRLQQWLLPRIATHMQTALETSPAFWNEMINGRNPLPTDDYRRVFFRRSFFVTYEHIRTQNGASPVNDPRLNSVRSYLDSLGGGVIVDTEYLGMSPQSLPDAPEYMVGCHIRTMIQAEDGGKQIRDGQFVCLFRPQRVRMEDEPSSQLDFPGLTLYPVYTD